MRYKRPVVQLTALLDLLFIMIFVSLSQSKTITAATDAPIQESDNKPIVKELSVSAEFSFYGTQTNRDIPSGAFNMKGTFDIQTGLLQLGGTSWTDRHPEGYDMVPLKGVIDQDRKTFKGRIEFYGCEEFTLTRVLASEGSEIAGKWEGKYSCLQGDTGLTLSVY